MQAVTVIGWAALGGLLVLLGQRLAELARGQRRLDASALAALGSWGVVELMGRVRYAGRLQVVRMGGAEVIRVEIPGAEPHEGPVRYVRPSALYQLTECDLDTAVRVAGEELADWRRGYGAAVPWKTAPSRPDRYRYDDGDDRDEYFIPGEDDFEDDDLTRPT